MDEQKLKEAIASIVKDKEALAQFIVEYVGGEHIATDYVSMLLDTRALQLGDILVKKLRKNNAKVRTLVPGAIPLSGEVTLSERANYVLDGAIISATANAWELESGELGTVQSIRSELDAKLRDFYINKVFTALSTIWTAVNTPTHYTACGGAITQTILDAAIEDVIETTGSCRAIVGTRKVLQPIMKFTGWTNDSSNYAASQERITQYLNTGWVGNYLGVSLVEIKQQYDYPDDRNTLIPTDKALVMGDKVGEFITYGGVRTQEYTDMRPVPPQWRISLFQQFGMIIDNAEGMHVLGTIS